MAIARGSLVRQRVPGASSPTLGDKARLAGLEHAGQLIQRQLLPRCGLRGPVPTIGHPLNQTLPVLSGR
jgi:hypothetical protein